jgi:hypothetical protein
MITSKVNPNDEWMNSNCQQVRTKRRKAERDHKRLKTPESKLALVKAHEQAGLVIN